MSLDAETLAQFLETLDRFVKERLIPNEAKIADDGNDFDPGQLIATPSVVRAETITLYEEWGRAALVENVETFKSQLIVERDPDDTGRMLVFHPPDIVNQLRVIGVNMAFIL